MTRTDWWLLLGAAAAAGAAIVYWRRSAPAVAMESKPAAFEQLIANRKMCMGKDGVNRPCSDATISLSGVL